MKLEWKSCLKVTLSAFVLFLCIYYWSNVVSLFSILLSAATPLLVGCVIAYLLNILMSFYEKHYFIHSSKPAVNKSRRPVCLFASFITLIAIIILIVCLIVPELGACFQLLFAEVPAALDAAVSWIKSLNIVPEDIVASLESIDWKSKVEQTVSILTAGVGNAMGTVINTVVSVISGIVTFFLALIFAIYLLIGKEKLTHQLGKVTNCYMKPALREKLTHTLSVLNDCFHRYIVGQCTEALILGGLCTLGMLILRLPYATMIGALIAFTALIPVAGAYIGAGVGAFMIFTVSPVKAVIFLIFIVVLQQLEGNLIYPRVVGSSLGLPAIWVLSAVTIGGGLLGIAGMLIGVPITAAAYRLLKEKVNQDAEKGVLQV